MLSARFRGLKFAVNARGPGGSRFCITSTVLPFSKRPPPPEEYFLRSGDFEAVQPAPSSGAPTPYAPRRSRSAPRASGLRAPGRAHPLRRSSQNQPTAVRQRSTATSPRRPPPHSLAPVAMGSDAPRRRHRSRRPREPRPGPSCVREKPSLKWGVMIALSGALLGGVLGLGMDARRQRRAPRRLLPRRTDSAPAGDGRRALPTRSRPTRSSLRPLPPPRARRRPRPRRGRRRQPAAARARRPAPARRPSSSRRRPRTSLPKATDTAREGGACAARHPSFVAAKVTAPKPPRPRRPRRRRKRRAGAKAEARRSEPAHEGRELERRDEGPRGREQGHDEHALSGRREPGRGP